MTKKMKVIFSLLEEVRHHIDGGVDCRTHEYHALDKLECAVSELADIVNRIEQREVNAAITSNP